MKTFPLLFMLLLCFGCTNQKQREVVYFTDCLDSISISSPNFDTLLENIKKLPHRQQVEILLNITSSKERDYKYLQKQNKLITEFMPLLSTKERKNILLQGMIISWKLDQYGDTDAMAEGIRRCEELEKKYSLSKKENWEVKKIKVSFLNEQGKYKKSLPILYDLLDEHRKAKEIAYIIEDRSAIATYFFRLGDMEKALSIYKDVYGLVLDNQMQDSQCSYLFPIINILYCLERYDKIVNLCNEINVDSVASLSPSIYSILSTCYLRLHKPDSARFYLAKMDKLSKRGGGTAYNCQMAETYLVEKKEDSATFYLNEAIRKYKMRNKLSYIDTLPRYFMPYCSEYASLLMRNGKVRQAEKVFCLIEPLMKQPVVEFERMKEQIDALYHYISFYRVTKQYDKATDLLIYRDSIQTVYNENRIDRDSKNAIERFENQELVYENKITKLELKSTTRISGVALGVIIILAILVFICILIILLLWKLYRKRNRRILELTRQPISLPKQVEIIELDPQQKFYDYAVKEVVKKKLFLDKELTLDKLAKELKSNRSVLSACINSQAKCNFNQWINSFRIDYAKEHIVASDSFEKLSEESGFSSYNTFCNCFKKHTGKTPSGYVKIHKYDSPPGVEA